MKRLKIASFAVLIAIVILAFTNRFTHPDCNNTNQLYWFKVNTSSITCSAVSLSDFGFSLFSSGPTAADAMVDFLSTSSTDYCMADDLLDPCPGMSQNACYIGYTFAQLSRVQVSPRVFVWRPTTVQTKTCCLTKMSN